jgi:hypothetical protein
MTPAPLVLIAGPYRRPRCRVGDFLVCVHRGRVAVAGFTAVPVRWPYGLQPNGRPGLIICGDLLRAVRTEGAMAVAQLFRVSRTTVARWRRWLSVNYPTGGTRGRLIAGKLRPMH